MKKLLIAVAIFLFFSCTVVGCVKQQSEVKEILDFTVCDKTRMPQELAEKIAEDAGDAVIAPIGISFGIDDDDEEDDCGCDCESECNGECGGRCSCEGKDECDDGHCCIKDSND